MTAKSALILFDLHPRYFQVDAGHCFICNVRGDIATAAARGMNAQVFEDGLELGPGNALHDEIRRSGKGRFSVWGSQLYFSSGDNSSPLDNGRSYQLLFTNARYEERISASISAARRLSRSALIPLDRRQFHGDVGYSFSSPLPGGLGFSNTDKHTELFEFRLYENGIEIGNASKTLEEIRTLGRGRFLVAGDRLYFASGDGSSPIENTACYHVLVPEEFFPAICEEESQGPRHPRKLPVADRIKHARELSRSVVLELNSDSFFPHAGKCFICILPEELSKIDAQALSFGSAARLFENGVELGPRVSNSEEIRTNGAGRFWHSGNQLYFSTLDNSSPITNRRNYELLLPSALIRPGASPPWLDGLDVRDLSALQRLELARTLYRSVWPGAVLPDMKRRIDHDQQFARDFQRVSPDANYTAERKFNLDQLFKLVTWLPGDIAECGVYKGASAFFLARHVVEKNLQKVLWLFDSFEGLSSPGDQDDQSYWYAGALASSPEDIRQALAPLGGVPFVRVCRGWIPERFQEAENKLFCFVHIDVDLYQPTLDSISFFYPRMVPGGIILLDDYGFDNCKGVTEAVDSFMQGRREPIVNLASGGAFIMRQRT
jgi:hypothetical protein